MVVKSSVNSKSAKDKEEQYIFDSQNGDDWIYFYDSSQRLKRKSPFKVVSISNTETILIGFKYAKTPESNAFHAGRCKFASLKPEDAVTKDDDLALGRLTVQEL